MKFLRALIKFIEGILLLIVPIIIFYWFLTVINLEIFKPAVALFNYICGPFEAFIKAYLNTVIGEGEDKVDFVLLIIAAVFMSSAFVAMGLERLLDIADSGINLVKAKAQEDNMKKQKESERVKYLEELAKNRVIFLSIKFRKKENQSSYLYASNENKSLPQDMNFVIQDIVNISEKFNAKNCKNVASEDNVYNFIFHDIIDAIDYSFYVLNNIHENNGKFAKYGAKLSAIIASNCSYSESNASNDFQVISKMINLGGETEILVSELFRNKYVALKSESNLKFISKGIYNVEDNSLEIFQLKVDPVKK